MIFVSMVSKGIGAESGLLLWLSYLRANFEPTLPNLPSLRPRRAGGSTTVRQQTSGQDDQRSRAL